MSTLVREDGGRGLVIEQVAEKDQVSPITSTLLTLQRYHLDSVVRYSLDLLDRDLLTVSSRLLEGEGGVESDQDLVAERVFKRCQEGAVVRVRRQSV